MYSATLNARAELSTVAPATRSARPLRTPTTAQTPISAVEAINIRQVIVDYAFCLRDPSLSIENRAWLHGEIERLLHRLSPAATLRTLARIPMQVTTHQIDLSKALSIVSRAVASRTATLPVLTHILLATDEGRLKVCATNLELGITTWCGAKVEAEGALCVPAKTLTELVALLPVDVMTLTVNAKNKTLNIKCGRTENNIAGIDASEFPVVPVGNVVEAWDTMSADEFRGIANRTVFAAATDESRPMLTGVYWQYNESGLAICAADGFRLSLCRWSEHTTNPKRALIVPSGAMTEVARLASDRVSLGSNGTNQAIFWLHDADTTRTVIVAQLIDQKYPAYEQTIPKSHTTRVVVSTAQLLRACRRAKIFTETGGVTLHIIPGEFPTMTIQSRADETGDSADTLTVDVDGPEIEISFNANYLIDALSRINTPTVALELTAPKSPGVFKPVTDDAGGSFLHVVMPVHLPGSAK